MLKLFRSLSLIIDYKTWIVTALSVITTYYCAYFKFIGDLPITLIGTAIIFPVVFSINSAYKRREDAIMCYASFKSNLLSLFLSAKNWTNDHQVTYVQQSKVLLVDCIRLMHGYFLQNPDNHAQRDRLVYQQFDEISQFIQTYRSAGVTPSELSRLDQYLSKCIVDFEKMRKIFLYRTPNSLRTYSKFFTYTFPVLYAPYFAHHLHDGNETLIGYLSAVLYSFVFVSLINIQDQLENPFDQYGEDDLQFDIEEFEDMLNGLWNKRKI